jgi:hypothetical protein
VLSQASLADQQIDKGILPLMRALLLSVLTFACVLPAQSDRATTLSLTGVCSGHDPQAKERVRLSLWLHDFKRDAAMLVGDAHSGADGSFSFPGVPRLAGNDWGFAYYIVLARQGASVGLAGVRGDAAVTHPVRIELLPGIHLNGSVSDEHGKPVAGAALRLWGLESQVAQPQANGFGTATVSAYFAETPPQWTTTTRADGTFTIPGVVPGCSYSMFAEAEGLVRKRITQDASAPFVFTLSPGATLEGRVKFADGHPAVRTKVCAQGIKLPEWGTTVTDEEGNYHLGSLPEGAYNVWIDTAEYTCVALDSVAATAGQRTKGNDIIAITGGFVVGRVIDADTGKPVKPGESSDVAMYGPSRPRSGAACDVAPVLADGTFRLRVAPGSNHVYLRAVEGFNPVAPDACDVDVAAGAEVKIEFKVRKPRK